MAFNYVTHCLKIQRYRQRTFKIVRKNYHITSGARKFFSSKLAILGHSDKTKILARQIEYLLGKNLGHLASFWPVSYLARRIQSSWPRHLKFGQFFQNWPKKWPVGNPVPSPVVGWFEGNPFFVPESTNDFLKPKQNGIGSIKDRQISQQSQRL